MAAYQTIDPARLDADTTCADPTDVVCSTPFLTAPDGTPISYVPGATLPQDIIRTERLGVWTWPTAPAPDPVGRVAEFVSFGAGDAVRQLTVLPGFDRLLVIAVPATVSVPAERSVTYGGVPLALGAPVNEFVQIFFMLDAPVGTAELNVSGGFAGTVIDAQYVGIRDLQSGQEASAANALFTPVGGGLVVFAMSAVGPSFSPLAGTTERVDFTGNWYGDRIISKLGPVTVGVVTATDPDYAGAIFNAVNPGS